MSTRRLRVVFMGTPELAVPTLAAVARSHDVIAVVTRPDRPRGRGKQVEPAAVKAWATDAGLAVMQPSGYRDAEAVAQLAALAPDVVVVVAYGVILPAAVLRIPPLGCVNLHTSLLPRHRGASPIQATLLAGDAEAGVTAMLMDEGLDTGPILLQRRADLQPDDTAGSLGVRLGAIGAEVILDTLVGLAAGTLDPVPQDEARATMTRRVRKVDGRVDWMAGAASIERQVRAMQPWPGAFTEWEGQRLMLWRVRPVVGAPSGPPGFTAGDGATFRVAAADGDLEVLELQRPGGRRMPTAEFLRGARDLVGSTLGRPA